MSLSLLAANPDPDQFFGERSSSRSIPQLIRFLKKLRGHYVRSLSASSSSSSSSSASSSVFEQLASELSRFIDPDRHSLKRVAAFASSGNWLFVLFYAPYCVRVYSLSPHLSMLSSSSS
jgi:hypothetical protein